MATPSNPLFERSKALLDRLNPRLYPEILKASPKTVNPLFTLERKEELAAVLAPHITTLLFLGLDDGSCFRFLRSWLQAKEARCLIFLETDLGKVHSFLSTPIGIECLEEKKCLLYPITSLFSKDFDPIRSELLELLNPGTVELLFLEFGRSDLQQLYAELIQGLSAKEATSLHYYHLLQSNFYQIYPHLKEALDMGSLVNLFQEIPAIIIGAGPSLQEMLPLVKKLEDRALLIGAGTGIKALYNHLLSPHFLVGIDPNFTQTEILKNIDGIPPPLIFSERFSGTAFTAYEGPSIYIRAIDGDQRFPDLLDPLFGRFYPHTLHSTSSSAFAADCARIMGASPIILTGVDLSYKACKKYSEAILGTHVYSKMEQLRHEKLPFDVTVAIDSEGTPHVTSLTFLREAEDFSLLANEMPKDSLVKADSKGFAVPNVPRTLPTSLEERFFQKQYDLRGLIHSALQLSLKAPRKKVEILDLLEKREEAIDKLLLKEDPFTPEDFSEYKGYNLFHITTAFLNRMKPPKTLLKKAHPELASETPLEIGCERDKLIRSHLQQEKKEIIRTKGHIVDLPSHIPSSDLFPLPPFAGKTIEWMEGKLLQRVETLGDTLEGFSRFFSPSGRLLAETEYRDGLRHGKATFFTKEGSLFSEQFFENGLARGVHLYSYPSGIIQAKLPYLQGRLEGECHFFSPDGLLVHILSYKKGRRDGVEILFNTEGKKIYEAHYQKGKAFGASTWWDDLGRKRRETQFDSSGKMRTTLEWNEHGEITLEEQEGRRVLDRDLEKIEKELERLRHE